MMIKSIVTYSDLYNQPREQGWWVCYTLSKKNLTKIEARQKIEKKLASFLFFNGFTNKKIYSIYKIVYETL